MFPEATHTLEENKNITLDDLCACGTESSDPDRH